MSAMGENTLDEFVGNLPDCHLAAREYASLKAKLADRDQLLIRCAVAWSGLKNLSADDDGTMERIYLSEMNDVVTAIRKIEGGE